MTWGSTIPAAKAALAAMWLTALGGTDVENGPVVNDDSSMEGVSVGYQDATSPGVDFQFAPDGFTSSPMLESYAVHCMVIVRDGDGDTNAAEARAFTLLGLMGGALAANPRLGGLVLSAHLGAGALLPTQTTVGATARIPVDVDVEAYTTT